MTKLSIILLINYFNSSMISLINILKLVSHELGTSCHFFDIHCKWNIQVFQVWLHEKVCWSLSLTRKYTLGYNTTPFSIHYLVHIISYICLMLKILWCYFLHIISYIFFLLETLQLRHPPSLLPLCLPSRYSCPLTSS